MKGTLCIVLMCLKKNVTQCYTSTYNILVLYNTLICRLHKYSTNANKKCTYVSKQYISTDHAVIILTFFSHSKNAITVLYSSIIYSVFLKFTYVYSLYCIRYLVVATDNPGSVPAGDLDCVKLFMHNTYVRFSKM